MTLMLYGGDQGQLDATFTELKTRLSRLVLGPPGKTGRCESGSVRQCGLKYVTDCLYSRYRADTDVKRIIIAYEAD